jgi:tRNA splicing ligase
MFEIIALVLSAVSLASSAVSARNQASAQEKIAENNAELARRQAREEEAQYRQKRDKELARMRAKAGGSGVQISGTLMDVIDESILNTELDTAEIRLKGENAMTNSLNTGSLQSASSMASATSNAIGAASSLLTVGAKVQDRGEP